MYDIFEDEWYRKELCDYVYSVINGTNPFNKLLVAKFLTIPRLSKRCGHKKMLPQTKQIMEHKTLFLIELSKLMGWEHCVQGTLVNFKGYRDWRKQYNGSLESVLFSTGKINEFDKQQFIDWFDKLPSQARFRVKNRILYSECEMNQSKWSKFQPWLKEWEQFKEQKQAEQRILEEKVRQNQASEEDKVKLEKIKKEAAHLMWDCANTDTDVLGRGGFRVEKDFNNPDDPWMRLVFEITDWDAAASELDEEEE